MFLNSSKLLSASPAETCMHSLASIRVHSRLVIPNLRLAASGFFLYLLFMSKPASKKKTHGKALMLGLGLDCDGHKRVTTGPNFALVGGSKETHAVMTEKALKINEKLKSKGKALEDVSREEFDEIAQSVGLQRNEPKRN